LTGLRSGCGSCHCCYVLDIKLIGDRPAGMVAADSPLVRVAQKSVTAVAPGRKVTLAGASTDSNQPMSGYPCDGVTKPTLAVRPAVKGAAAGA
jgi:hypothetical protein